MICLASNTTLIQKKAIRELNARRLVSWEDGRYRVAGSVGVIVNHNLMYNHPAQWAEIQKVVQRTTWIHQRVGSE